MKLPRIEFVDRTTVRPNPIQYVKVQQSAKISSDTSPQAKHRVSPNGNKVKPEKAIIRSGGLNSYQKLQSRHTAMVKDKARHPQLFATWHDAEQVGFLSKLDRSMDLVDTAD